MSKAKKHIDQTRKSGILSDAHFKDYEKVKLEFCEEIARIKNKSKRSILKDLLVYKKHKGEYSDQECDEIMKNVLQKCRCVLKNTIGIKNIQ